MSEMVERVAKAIHAAQYARIHDEALGLTDLDVARAAISAMREPTDAMRDAATKAAERDEAHMSTYHCVSEGYRAAMDEALK